MCVRAKSTKQSRRSRGISAVSISGIIIVLFCLVTAGRMSHELNTIWSMAEELNRAIDLPHIQKSVEAIVYGTNKNLQQTKPKGRPLKLVQIGANDGVTGNVIEVTKILNSPDSKAILVEGSPSMFQLLKANVKANYDSTLQRIAVRNALICEEGKKKIFYSVDVPKMMKASITENYNLPHWVKYQISSLERSTIHGLLSGYLTRGKGRKHFANITADDVIMEELLDCVSFKSILSKAPFDPEEVDVLAVDVEGFDAPVMLESFKLPGLEPNLIIFEWKHTVLSFKKEFNEVMDTLSRRGYKLNCKKLSGISGDWHCDQRLGRDVIARKS